MGWGMAEEVDDNLWYYTWHGFFLPMAHHANGDPKQARERYDQLVAFFDENPSPHPELDAYRAEAEEVLGIARDSSDH